MARPRQSRCKARQGPECHHPPRRPLRGPPARFANRRKPGLSGLRLVALLLALVSAGLAAQQLGTAAKPTYVVLDSEGRESTACSGRGQQLPEGGWLFVFDACQTLFRDGFEVRP